ncbi:hypothetical protein DGI_0949 [Megalodesulfovibrio gigas DSM 1382 = ATCC 19364]|uniref:Uncharacterized protein n=1 Tax=Megalodesulfovibrio gigas (strain ATCC 19364 / DSM 1382 / NCIMB 9332 / VKM B-1759) TaxID=1121448 RepID=T2G9H7_MEGG1|nr:hypothetical protein DGI_0949 [Megalodesulfovibrio gigas DSM 1382 = ATCC 19364]
MLIFGWLSKDKCHVKCLSCPRPIVPLRRIANARAATDLFLESASFLTQVLAKLTRGVWHGRNRMRSLRPPAGTPAGGTLLHSIP